jgi:uncharacterized repeat protein (TIGR03803 family)
VIIRRTPQVLSLASNILIAAAVSCRSAPARTEAILYSFCSQGGNSCTDGVEPLQNSLVSDAEGNLYGTTNQGGPTQGGDVFKLAPDGSLTIILSFPDPYGAGGSTGGVVRDDAGNLYGATYDHVFKVAPDGTETLLHYFAGNGDGQSIYSGLSRDKKGNLYGATVAGGAFSDGTIFKINAKGKESLLHSFDGSDGVAPQSPPILSRDGNLYGVSPGGGLQNCNGGCGVVYKITTAGAFKVIYKFTGGVDGYYPIGSPATDNVGNLYGTADGGGNFDCGAVFKIAPNGSQSTLHTFTFNEDFHDGCHPISQPVLDKKGNLYGLTRDGGDNSRGTIFMITARGNEKILYSFAGSPDGAQPEGTLLRDSMGNLYGTSLTGGAHGWGTVFKLSVGQ